MIKNLHNVVSLWENVLSACEYLVMCWTHMHNTSKDSSGSFNFGGHYNVNAQTQKVSLLNFSAGP